MSWADRKSSEEVRTQIEKAFVSIEEVSKTTAVRYFSYFLSLARYYTEKARTELDRGEEGRANFYASLGDILARTALYRTKTYLLKIRKGEKEVEMVFSDAQILRKKGREWMVSERARITFSSWFSVFSFIPELKIEVEGHTSGEDLENQSLAKALLFKDYLVQFGGISEANCRYRGYRNQKPLMKSGKPQRGRINDRIE